MFNICYSWSIDVGDVAEQRQQDGLTERMMEWVTTALGEAYQAGEVAAVQIYKQALVFLGSAAAFCAFVLNSGDLFQG